MTNLGEDRAILAEKGHGRSGRWLARVLLAGLCLGTLGCAEGFETPSAYDGQRYLCEPGSRPALAMLLDQCRQDRAAGRECGGVASLRGRLQGQPLVVETRLSGTRLTIVGTDPAGDRLDVLETSGSSPYFAFTMTWKSLGGATGDPPGRKLALDEAATMAAGGLQDDRVFSAIRLLAGGEAVRIVARTGSGDLVLSQANGTELAGDFRGTFGDTADTLEGCFHALVQGTTRAQEAAR